MYTVRTTDVAIVELIALITASDSYYIFGARLLPAAAWNTTVSFRLNNKRINATQIALQNLIVKL